MVADRRRLGWLEVGRGLAALAVVLTHYDPWFHGNLPPPYGVNPHSWGAGAVEFFFILSGFIIFFIHGDEVSKPRCLPRYAWRRFVRVFPTYWMILLVAVAVNQTLQKIQYRADLTPLLLLRELFLWPGEAPFFIGPAWTLRHELLFYAIFALTIVRSSIGIPVFIGWMIAAALNLTLQLSPTGMVFSPLGIVLHHYNLDFGLGVLIALAARHDRMPLALIIAGTVLGLLAIFSVIGLGDHGIMVALENKAIFALGVSLAVVASQRSIPAPRVGIALGAISYALYVSHILAGLVSRNIMKTIHPFPEYWLTIRLGIEVSFALLVAWVVHQYFEVPVLRFCRRFFAKL